MLTQLKPALPVTVDGRKGRAIAVIDYGEEDHLLWVVAFDADGAIWCVPNPEIRLQHNYSLRRRY